MPNATPNDIWLFVYYRHEVRYSDLKKAFVDNGKMANQTFVNYLKELQKDDKIEKDYNKRLGAIVYFVPLSARGYIKTLIDNLEFDKNINDMTEQEAKETLKELIHGTI